MKSKSKCAALFLVLPVLVLIACSGGHEVVKTENSDPQNKPVNPSNGTLGFADVKAVLDIPGKSCLKCHTNKRPLVTYNDVKKFVVAGNPSASKLWTELTNNGGDMPPKGDALTDAEAAVIKLWIEQGAWEVGSTEEPGSTTTTVAENPVETPSSTTVTLPLPTQPTQPAPGQPEPMPLPPPPGMEPTPTPTTVPAQPMPPQPLPTEPQPLPSSTTTLPSLPPALTFDVIYKAVLEPKCALCHDSSHAKAGVDVSNYDAMLKNLSDDGNTVLVPGDLQKSAIYTEILDGSMPPKKAIAAGKVKPVTAEELALLKQWIEDGAPR